MSPQTKASYRQHNLQMQQYDKCSINKNNTYNRFWFTNVAILICLLVSGVSKTNAVPTDSDGVGGPVVVRTTLLQRALRDVSTMMASLVQEDTNNNSNYNNNNNNSYKDAATSTETLPPEQQGQCLLDGVLVPETKVYCEKQVGCRAIQKTGHCCPDYKCDCEKDGKTYLHGDKLVDPETPCTVCYCQGGEILCSSVTCFHRDDCTPKYIQGRCCPEYDNCPVLNNDVHANKSYTNAAPVYTKKPEAQGTGAGAMPVLNPKITIKEITKPTEIRITDDNKAIPIHQMLKPSSTTTTTTTKTTAETSSLASSSLYSTPAVTATATPTVIADASSPANDNDAIVINNNESSTVKAFTDVVNSSNNNDKSNEKASIPMLVGINNNESLKLTASVAYPRTEAPAPPMAATTLFESATSMSSLAPIADVSTEDIDAIPAVNSNGDEQSISVFGTPGLQRVESEAANDSSKVNIKREYFITTEAMPQHVSSNAAEDFDSSPEVIYANIETVPNAQTGNLKHTSAELDPDTAGSDNIYHIIMTTEGPRLASSTEEFLAQKGLSSTEGIEIEPAFETHDHSENFNNDNFSKERQAQPQTPSDAVMKPPQSTQAPKQSTTFEGLTTQGLAAELFSSSTSESTESSSINAMLGSSTTDATHHMEEEEIVAPMESNPAYPSLPEDDFSLRDVNFPLAETDDAAEADMKDEPRSISSTAFDALKSTKHLEATMEGSGSGDISSTASESLYESSTSTTESLASIPEKIALMYSVEDTSAETAIANGSDFQMDRIMRDAENDSLSTLSLESQELDTLVAMAGSGSGSGELVLTQDKKRIKQRESTTPRPTRKPADELDIDELGAASGDGKSTPLEDPKLDVESLKLDESELDGLPKTDAAPQSNILSVKLKPTQEKTFEEQPATTGQNLGRVQRLFLQRVF